MPQNQTSEITKRESVYAVTAFLFWLLLGYAAQLVITTAPGSWKFVVVVTFPLPVALFAGLRLGGVSAYHTPLAGVTETTAAGAGFALGILALLGADPHLAGGFEHFPAALTAAIVIAVSEEFIFRGALLGALARRYGYMMAVTVTSLLFAGVHLDAGVGAGVTAFFAGMALGGLALRGGLGAAVAFHAVFNVLTGPVFGLQVGNLPWPGLLSPGLERNPLEFLPVQLLLLLLMALWAPWGLRRREQVDDLPR